MHCKKILCVFCCFFALCLCACTAAEPSYITFTQPQAGFTMQVPADWSQQTTVLSAEIIRCTQTALMQRMSTAARKPLM